MKTYPVIISGGAVVPIAVEPTHTPGLKAILIDGRSDILGYTARVSRKRYRYRPTVAMKGEEINLPLATHRMEAIVDIVNYLDAIGDPRLDSVRKKVMGHADSGKACNETMVEM